MSTNNVIPEYQSFNEFYLQQVIPYKQLNPTHIRLDGKILGSSRNVSAYFWYLNKKWKVDADTHIDRLKLAFYKSETTAEPFSIKQTRDKKGECLVIKGQPLRDKKFYIYKASKE
ncbi:hypothetical protein [Pedobacter sp. JCM 36344]|uniref:hypothetical protein n=1 Tax=Pedobacter sp. JCM 36344 TaxID=3374280 RepID=UPI00397852B2